MSAVIDCPTCRDSGLRPGRFYSKEFDGVVNCPSCWPQRVSAWAVEKAGIRPLYRGATLDVYNPDGSLGSRQLFDRCVAYTYEWEAVKQTGRCLSLLGPEGIGKSHLANAICHRLIEKFWTRSVDDQDVCLILSAHAWFSDWGALYSEFPDKESRNLDPQFTSRQESLAKRDRRLRETELLVIDDLSKFDLRREKLERLLALIEYRVSNCMPIVVTENAASWEEVKERLGSEFGPGIVDRLIRSGETVIVPPTKKVKGKTK